MLQDKATLDALTKEHWATYSSIQAALEYVARQSTWKSVRLDVLGEVRLTSHPRVPTACVRMERSKDRSTIALYFNPTWIEEKAFSSIDIAVVIDHELHHFALKHIPRFHKYARRNKKANNVVFNLFADALINSSVLQNEAYKSADLNKLAPTTMETILNGLAGAGARNIYAHTWNNTKSVEELCDQYHKLTWRDGDEKTPGTQGFDSNEEHSDGSPVPRPESGEQSDPGEEEEGSDVDSDGMDDSDSEASKEAPSSTNDSSEGDGEGDGDTPPEGAGAGLADDLLNQVLTEAVVVNGAGKGKGSPMSGEVEAVLADYVSIHIPDWRELFSRWASNFFKDQDEEQWVKKPNHLRSVDFGNFAMPFIDEVEKRTRRVHVYGDISGSMACIMGKLVASIDSVFDELIDPAASSLLSNKADNDIRFYAFGTSVDAIDNAKDFAVEIQQSRNYCGGTSFHAVNAHVNASEVPPDLVVVITDGKDSAPEIASPATWCWILIQEPEYSKLDPWTVSEQSENVGHVMNIFKES